MLLFVWLKPVWPEGKSRQSERKYRKMYSYNKMINLNKEKICYKADSIIWINILGWRSYKRWFVMIKGKVIKIMFQTKSHFIKSKNTRNWIGFERERTVERSLTNIKTKLKNETSKLEKEINGLPLVEGKWRGPNDGVMSKSTDAATLHKRW